jgi:hypothetical protein
MLLIPKGELDSNLGSDADYAEFFHGCLQFLLANAMIILLLDHGRVLLAPFDVEIVVK